MKHFLRICTACAAVAAASTLPAVEVILDGCRSTAGWNSFNGSEFKGAKVSLSGGADGLKLGYDFAGGGQYVGCHPKKLAVPQADSLSVTVNASSPVGFNYRLIDSTGRTFQGKGFTLRQGVDEKLTLSTTGPWSTAWGGSGNHNRPEFPLKSVWLMATKGKDQPPAGTVTIKSVTAEVPELPENAVSGTGFERDLAGWTLKGEWMPQLEGAMLKITPVSAGDRPAQLEIVFPQPGRDLARRYRLTPGNTNPVYYKVPFPAEVNPRNRYRITLKVADDNGARAEFVTTLSGKLAGTVNLGDPRSSREIEKSKFGTCVHFSYAPKPEGAFKGWYPKELLLDEISNCGFKFIREGLAMDKLPDGSWKIRDVDLETLKKAKERGIEQIVVIGMSAKETIPEFLNKVRAMVEQSRDYVNIYELGNEPNNFGQWRQTFRHKGKDGSWNGYESDGTVSEWVRKHVEYTNAGADLIKKIAPDKTVIGLGSCAPTNFHALNAGVSKNLDGVVEHPYTFSLPPEKVPFGKRLAKRDGIAIGDDEHTFRGLVLSRTLPQDRKTAFALGDGIRLHDVRAERCESEGALCRLQRAGAGALSAAALRRKPLAAGGGQLPVRLHRRLRFESGDGRGEFRDSAGGLQPQAGILRAAADEFAAGRSGAGPVASAEGDEGGPASQHGPRRAGQRLGRGENRCGERSAACRVPAAGPSE